MVQNAEGFLHPGIHADMPWKHTNQCDMLPSLPPGSARVPVLSEEHHCVFNSQIPPKILDRTEHCMSMTDFK